MTNGKNEPKLAGSLRKYNFAQADNVWSIGGVCPTILAYNAGQIGHQINILEESDVRLSDTASEEGG